MMGDNQTDGDNVMVKFRMQYVKDLEEILECPICMDLPNGSIITCIKGHHVCQTCHIASRRQNCPTCFSNFNGSRNYVAEKVAAKFEDIKCSLLEPNHRSNRKTTYKTVESQTPSKEIASKETQTINEASSTATQTNFSETSIQCQTDFYGDDAQTQTDQIENIDDSYSSSDENSNISDESPHDVDAELPLITCFIKSCNTKCDVDTIIKHIQSNHRENIEESIKFENHVANDKYQTSWTYNYEANKSYDHAINIFEMGLIFFNILIDEDGNVHGNIRVAKSYCNQQDIYYLILIGNDEIFLSEIFKGIIPYSVDDNAENSSIYVDKSIFSDYILDENQIFQCSLTLYKPEI